MAKISSSHDPNSIPKDYGIYNLQFIFGYLGKDPEIKTNKRTGQLCVYMNVCAGMQWMTVVCFEPLANYVVHKFKKGDAIMVNGVHRTYQRRVHGSTCNVLHSQLHAIQIGVPIVHRQRDRLPPLIAPDSMEFLELMEDL